MGYHEQKHKLSTKQRSTVIGLGRNVRAYLFVMAMSACVGVTFMSTATVVMAKEQSSEGKAAEFEARMKALRNKQNSTKEEPVASGVDEERRAVTTKTKATETKAKATKAETKASKAEAKTAKAKAAKAARKAMRLAYADLGGINIAEDKEEFPPENDKDWTRILGSKHDLTALNKRAGVNAMSGVAFAEYDNFCIYCHIPKEADDGRDNPARIPAWNRVRSQTQQYEMYDSATMDRKSPRPQDIGDMTLLCLSCHDGTQAVDRVVFKPRAWNSSKSTALHMRLNASDDLRSCGKCHNGKVAHNIVSAQIGTELKNDHPISIPYAGLNAEISGFRGTDYAAGFENGIKLFDGRIECATCHDVHDPDARLLLRTEAEYLCSTCHIY